MLLNDVRTLLITVQLQLWLYEGCRRVYLLLGCEEGHNRVPGDGTRVFLLVCRKHAVNNGNGGQLW